MNILISKLNPKPIYEQIKEQIIQAILNGDVNEGDLLPSVRGLAKDLKISVITTKRAYEDLEREGYVTSVVGKGTYIAQQDRDFIRRKYLKRMEELTKKLLEENQMLGLSLEEIKEMVERIFKEV
ncbi:GntR family transcriptional regulator [Facklamia miroungae]|uniref:GntR family transcriptional regulator n=1 Tax=Facklamia miroungae TaxID=120956 RepID=A0A1G7QKG8_9LACT|nr:GntR family transcriptional regulator [Facklamia miroungae]NKZ28956.1 GntR family transcriptional regulator [Facklamia miroungae]SDF98399.1 GntR family transcriptional regulator [Facklamia miroungae]